MFTQLVKQQNQNLNPLHWVPNHAGITWQSRVICLTGRDVGRGSHDPRPGPPPTWSCPPTKLTARQDTCEAEGTKEDLETNQLEAVVSSNQAANSHIPGLWLPSHSAQPWESKHTFVTPTAQ